MLVELRIRNFAIIEGAALYFGPGFNVLSGETGAGKTIIMTALGLLLGTRASPDMVRAAQSEAVVEGLFELEGEAPLPEGMPQDLVESAQRELLVRRAIASDGGRSRAYLNSSIATVQTLARMGESLVEVYGQHEQQTLLRPDSHLELLDRHAGLDSVLEEYRAAYRETAAARAQLRGYPREPVERGAKRAFGLGARVGDAFELGDFRARVLHRFDYALQRAAVLAL